MDNATAAAYVRISALTRHDQLQMYGAALLLADIRLVCAELARLRTEGEGLRAALEQAGRAVEAERRARQIAEARGNG
jgi:hypothetical protein